MTFDPPRSQAELISELVDMNLDYVPRSKCPALRSEHAKGVADVTATFTVLDGIAADYATGLFAHPAAYAATLRFSNSAAADDSKRDTHGLAVKVQGVPMSSAPTGPNGQRFQDFILLDSPVFFMGDLRRYVPINAAFLESNLSFMGKLKLVWALLGNLHAAYYVILMALRRPNAPLSTDYWSTTPYRLGPHKVKYWMQAQPRPDPAPEITGPDGRRDALRQQLNAGPGVFTFGVLVQNDPARQPIEDPTVDWQENGAQFVALAQVSIPAGQPVGATGPQENALTFSPGHAAAEHAPLGAINRARVAIYAAASQTRQVEARKIE